MLHNAKFILLEGCNKTSKNLIFTCFMKNQSNKNNMIYFFLCALHHITKYKLSIFGHHIMWSTKDQDFQFIVTVGSI